MEQPVQVRCFDPEGGYMSLRQRNDGRSRSESRGKYEVRNRGRSRERSVQELYHYEKKPKEVNQPQRKYDKFRNEERFKIRNTSKGKVKLKESHNGKRQKSVGRCRPHGTPSGRQNSSTKRREENRNAGNTKEDIVKSKKVLLTRVEPLFEQYRNVGKPKDEDRPSRLQDYRIKREEETESGDVLNDLQNLLKRVREKFRPSQNYGNETNEKKSCAGETQSGFWPNGRNDLIKILEDYPIEETRDSPNKLQVYDIEKKNWMQNLSRCLYESISSGSLESELRSIDWKDYETNLSRTFGSCNGDVSNGQHAYGTSNDRGRSLGLNGKGKDDRWGEPLTTAGQDKDSTGLSNFGRSSPALHCKEFTETGGKNFQNQGAMFLDSVVKQENRPSYNVNYNDFLNRQEREEFFTENEIFLDGTLSSITTDSALKIFSETQNVKSEKCQAIAPCEKMDDIFLSDTLSTITTDSALNIFSETSKKNREKCQAITPCEKMDYIDKIRTWMDDRSKVAKQLRPNNNDKIEHERNFSREEVIANNDLSIGSYGSISTSVSAEPSYPNNKFSSAVNYGATFTRAKGNLPTRTDESVITPENKKPYLGTTYQRLAGCKAPASLGIRAKVGFAAMNKKSSSNTNNDNSEVISVESTTEENGFAAWASHEESKMIKTKSEQEIILSNMEVKYDHNSIVHGMTTEHSSNLIPVENYKSKICKVELERKLIDMDVLSKEFDVTMESILYDIKKVEGIRQRGWVVDQLDNLLNLSG
eukprot:CAMPEP_0194271370 /NCGR_PEP_ID=MMETSP0169-20130528/5167_1 /TAXON_ID=218684 /ORGANISM="Corethron pennatum, Strain L29A3" /LENGTH=758 /DNA_ID=CAMNT_0039013699 /DNA_START=65 /DNA_END=2341 /DNA_ORIENTATION=-